MTNDFNKTENENRFRVYKVDDMYGVNDNDAGYGVAWDKSKLIADNLCELLNELNNENTHIKTTLNNMIESERTELGKSVLKQFKEAIK